MAFSPDYVRLVLSDNFEHAKSLFLAPLMSIHYAHLAMLAERRIVTPADGVALRRALESLDLAAIHRAGFDGTCEDLFFYVDRQIAAICGPDTAGRLHIARSRNDIDMTMYRIRLREFVLALADGVLVLRRALIDVASRHTRTIFPAHTHAQPAQPTTVAHYLLGVIEELDRDTTRLLAAYETTNQSPLGACAITGTGFPIDRERTSALLGFRAPTGNTYGSIATVDYLLESAASAAITLVGLGRFVQDMLLWSTCEVGYLRLPDGFVQVSSIMPQKRNPVALEHARALASRAVAELAAIPQVVHNTPFGDIVDTEDDLQPLVASAFHNATRSVTLVGATMAGAEFDVARMAERAGENWITATELADSLVRDHGLPFSAAHAVSAAFVRAPQATSGETPAGRLRQVARELGYDIQIADDALAELLSPAHFIDVRRTDGGPAPSVTSDAIDRARARHAVHGADVAHARRALGEADVQLREAVHDIGRDR